MALTNITNRHKKTTLYGAKKRGTSKMRYVDIRVRTKIENMSTCNDFMS